MFRGEQIAMFKVYNFSWNYQTKHTEKYWNLTDAGMAQTLEALLAKLEKQQAFYWANTDVNNGVTIKSVSDLMDIYYCKIQPPIVFMLLCLHQWPLVAVQHYIYGTMIISQRYFQRYYYGKHFGLLVWSKVYGIIHILTHPIFVTGFISLLYRVEYKSPHSVSTCMNETLEIVTLLLKIKVSFAVVLKPNQCMCAYFLIDDWTSKQPGEPSEG